MNEPAQTRQQRDIIGNLTKTLDTFDPAQSPYTEGTAPQPPAASVPTHPRSARRIAIRPRRASRSWPAPSSKSVFSTPSASARLPTATTPSSTAKAALLPRQRYSAGWKSK